MKDSFFAFKFYFSLILTSCVSAFAANAQNFVINEIQAANIDQFVDPTFNYGGWIEIYNPSSDYVFLTQYYLSDDPENLQKYRLNDTGTIMPNKYKTIWFDHKNLKSSQVDTTLNPDGGVIYISDRDGNIITSAEYPKAIGRTSYARISDGGDTWGITANPTPGASNAKSVFATEQVEAPVVDTDATVFSGLLAVKVTVPEGATLRYTTDGSVPTMTNGNNTTLGTFVISNSTKVYRFRAFEEGKIPSEVVTRSYIYRSRSYKFPIISIVADHKNLYGDSLGVYVKGVNGRVGNGQRTKCNWNMDWSRPVNFEYITEDNKMAYNQECDFEMCGGWSRAWTPHSFKVHARKIYGKNSFDYPFFASKPNLKHKVLQIRNGGNDNYCRIKDASMQEIVRRSGLYVDCQAWQPIHNFINGSYIGVLNMREPNNKHFAYANYGIDTDYIDQFEMNPDSGYVQKSGTNASFLELYNLSKTASEEASYSKICQLLDIDEYVNYMAVELYLGGTDWPQNNVKGFRDQNDGKFHFVLFDLDFVGSTNSPFTNFSSKQIYTFDEDYVTGRRKTEEIKFVTIFLNLLKNEVFRKKFIDTYCLVNGSVYTPERCSAIINEMATYMASGMQIDGVSPWGSANELIGSFNTMRQETMMSDLRQFSQMRLSGKNPQYIKLSTNVAEGRILVNDIEVPLSKFDGQLYSPIRLKAEAPAGYRFAGWTNAQKTINKTLIARGSSWNYYDSGSLDNYYWNVSGFTQSGWKQGNAPLGYSSNNSGFKTILNYGSSSNKRPTYYFRKTVTLDATPGASDKIFFNFTVDDGLIVYVNGEEAGRYNMPGGYVNYNTFASSYAPGNPDVASMELDPQYFKEGENMIAVEVHNNNSTSTDIHFDASLEIRILDLSSPQYYTTDPEFTMPSTGSYSFSAIFEPIPFESMAAQVPVRINELSASNDIFVNEYFKKNDWIELYNTTDKPIDVAGMFVSDNDKKPQKYQIPAATAECPTVIQPHGYLTIWADKLEPLGQLHASFKLDGVGGKVLLTAADESWSDELTYGEHAWNESVGRYPDGADKVYQMTKPTLGKSNILTTYSQYLYSADIDATGLEEIDEIAEGGKLMLVLREGIICVYGANHATVEVYDLSGRRVLKADGNVSVKELPSGCYLVRAFDQEGNVETLRMTK